MEFLIVVTLLVLVLGLAAALLPFAAFSNRLTRPFRRRVPEPSTAAGQAHCVTGSVE